MLANRIKHAGCFETFSAGSCCASTALPEGIQRQLLPLRRHHREPAHQRRHKGHLPGLHRKAGHVSLPPSSAASSSSVAFPMIKSTRKNPFAIAASDRDTSSISPWFILAVQALLTLRHGSSFHAQQAIDYGKTVSISIAPMSWKNSKRDTILTQDINRHQGCWRNQPQEGRLNTPGSPSLRQRLRCREGDRCHGNWHLRPVCYC